MSVLLFDIAYGKNNMVEKVVFDVKPILYDLLILWNQSINCSYFSRILLRLLRQDVRNIHEDSFKCHIVGIKLSDIRVKDIPRSYYMRLKTKWLENSQNTS